MSGLLNKLGRSRVVQLDDERKQVTDRFEIRGDLSDPANLAIAFPAYDTPHPKYTTCLLRNAQVISASAPQAIQQELIRVYIEPGPATARAIKDTARLIFPFRADGDLVTAEIQQDYIIATANYAPPTLSAAYANEALLNPQPSGSFYLVGDYNERKVECDATRYTRIWTKVPATRTVALGTFPFQYPAVAVGTGGSMLTITALSPNTGNTPTVTPTCTTGSAHGLAVGDLVSLRVRYSATPAGVYRGGTLRVTAVPSTTTFTTTNFVLFIGGTFNDGTFAEGNVTKIALGREQPEVMAGAATAVYDYALPGVTSGVASSLDFPAVPEFRPFVVATNIRTNSLTAATIPTSNEYHADVLARATLVARSGVKRYKGAILERETINVVAL
jgi:hypothetical protein